MATGKTGVGVIGCGFISDIYLTVCSTFDALEVRGCADVVRARAEAQAAKHGIRAYNVDELLADPDVEIVVNLTIPQAHAAVSAQALAAGKSVYSEKPL